MIKQIIYFLIQVCITYSLLITYYLITNNQFTYEYKWCIVIALVSSLFTSLGLKIADNFHDRKKNKSV